MSTIDDMSMFHQSFFEEAGDLLRDLEGQLLQLEESPSDEELLNTIFRCAHSIKGGSATFGFTDIAHFTHGLETLLDKARKHQLVIDHDITAILFASLDHMNALLSYTRGDSKTLPDGTALSARIDAACSGETPAASPAVSASPVVAVIPSEPEDSCYTLRIVPGIDVLRQGADPILLISKLASFTTVDSVRCDTSRLPALAEADPEGCYLSWEIALSDVKDKERVLDLFSFIADDSEIVLTPVGGLFLMDEAPVEAAVPAVEVAAAPNASPKPAASASSAKSADHSLRVSTEKIDKLINLVGELVINQSMLNETMHGFSMTRLSRLYEAVAQMERNSRELQEQVMAIRMLPIKHAFGRFPRLVRDLSGTVGKKIELTMSGEETELDKTVIELIADPLTHLVRNSIDHGLETPNERRAAGKPETGVIALNAFHEGGGIVIEISDDGRGLHRERILKKAVERGLLAEGENPTDDVVNNMIFQAGFSTAKEVTDLSGRGVGMDIVKQAVVGLGGAISLTSTPGAGTRFRIRLPLTMAILEGLSLSVGEEVYIVPLTSIIESIQPKTADVRMIAGKGEVVMVRGDILPIVRLYDRFDALPRVTDPASALLVIVENDGHRIALMVDELIGQSQVVIKSLEENYRKVDGIAGATILGDGRIALIIDVAGLTHADAVRSAQRDYAAAA